MTYFFTIRLTTLAPLSIIISGRDIPECNFEILTVS